MSKCPLYNENMISSYVSGLLNENESIIFEKHLMECDICLQYVMDLRNDLFKMGLYENQLYKSAYMIEAVFLLFKNRFLILRDVGRKSHFKQLSQSFKIRGKSNNNYYHVEIEDVDIIIGKDSKEKFLIELSNVREKFIELFTDNRLIEAHSNPDVDKMVVRSLNRGEYIIFISEIDKSGIEKLENTKRKRVEVKIRVN